MKTKYIIGHSYVDTGGSSRSNDQFLRWINIPSSGMRNADGIRALNYVDFNSEYIPAYIILVSHEIKRKGNPWNDIVDYNSATIFYWGDAKFDKTKNYTDYRGNKRLLQTWETILDGNITLVPPILHFSKPQKGIVQFNGLCILRDLELTWFEQTGFPIKNYRCNLTILDCESVDTEWLHERAKCNDILKLNNNAPKIWKDYINGNIHKLDIWKKEILTKEEQLPDLNSKDSLLLKQLNNLTPTQFEAVVVKILENLPHINHKVTRTRPTADGGFDFYGSFSIPFPVKYEIEFLGEVKKFSRDSAVQPKHVSRLVARLNRGQYGLFVTTSYYTRQAQLEVLEDGYPIKLFAGIDIINFLKELRLINEGILKREWIESIFKEI